MHQRLNRMREKLDRSNHEPLDFKMHQPMASRSPNQLVAPTMQGLGGARLPVLSSNSNSELFNVATRAATNVSNLPLIYDTSSGLVSYSVFAATAFIATSRPLMYYACCSTVTFGSLFWTSSIPDCGSLNLYSKYECQHRFSRKSHR